MRSPLAPNTTRLHGSACLIARGGSPPVMPCPPCGWTRATWPRCAHQSLVALARALSGRMCALHRIGLGIHLHKRPGRASTYLVRRSANLTHALQQTPPIIRISYEISRNTALPLATTDVVLAFPCA